MPAITSAADPTLDLLNAWKATRNSSFWGLFRQIAGPLETGLPLQAFVRVCGFHAGRRILTQQLNLPLTTRLQIQPLIAIPRVLGYTPARSPSETMKPMTGRLSASPPRRPGSTKPWSSLRRPRPTACIGDPSETKLASLG